MAAPIGGSLSVQGRFPLDDKYWVESFTNLDDGLIYDGLHRWTKDTQEEYVRRFGVWIKVGSDTEAPTIDSATYTTRGIVQIGDGITVDELGVITANIQTDNNYTDADLTTVVTSRAIALLQHGTTNRLLYDPNEINNRPVSGDRLFFLKIFTLQTLILVDNVTYYTNNLSCAIALITDTGVSVKAKVLGGMPPNPASRRFMSFTGVDTIVTIEADTYFSRIGNEVSIGVANSATLYHNGSVFGGGGSDKAIAISNSAKYYHKGECKFFGGYGISASGDAYIEMRETSPTTFDYRQAVLLTGNAVCDYYGGITREITVANPITVNIGVADNAILNLKEGTYTNISPYNNEVISLSGNAVANISSLVRVIANDTAVSANGTPILNLKYGASIQGNTTGVTIVNQPADRFVPFKIITTNQYGTHPAFYNQDDLNVYLLGGTIAPAPQETLTINSVIAS